MLETPWCSEAAAGLGARRATCETFGITGSEGIVVGRLRVAICERAPMGPTQGKWERPHCAPLARRVQPTGLPSQSYNRDVAGFERNRLLQDFRETFWA